MKKYLILFALILIQGCSSGGGDTAATTPTTPTAVTFSLSKLNSTDVGIVYSTNLIGNDSTGTIYAGSLALANREVKMLNGVLVTPRDLLLTFSDGVTPITINGTSSIDASGNLIEYTITTTGSTCAPAYLDVAPQSVEIGDFGIKPTISCDDNTTVDSSWRVEDAGSGKANLITASTTKDLSNSIVSTSEAAYTIDKAGNILGTYVTSTLANGFSLNLSSTNSAPIIPTPPPVATGFITWTGSANGTVVIDATDDAFQFLTPSGLMYFGSTIITNVWVDSSSNLFYNGVKIGAVQYVKATNGSTITALVSNTGYYLDFYGPESSLTWSISSKIPVAP